MSIKNLLSDNTKSDQNLQVNSIEFNDLNTDYETVNVVYPAIPVITKTFSTINYSSFPDINGQTSLILNVDCSALGISFPLVFVSFNTQAGDSSLQQIVASVYFTNGNIINVLFRNTSASATTGSPHSVSINLMVIGIQ